MSPYPKENSSSQTTAQEYLGGILGGGGRARAAFDNSTKVIWHPVVLGLIHILHPHDKIISNNSRDMK